MISSSFQVRFQQQKLELQQHGLVEGWSVEALEERLGNPMTVEKSCFNVR